MWALRIPAATPTRSLATGRRRFVPTGRSGDTEVLLIGVYHKQKLEEKDFRSNHKNLRQTIIIMTSIHMPKLFFVGAGNIAQSIMKGILRAKPEAASQIMATAPTFRNLNIVQDKLGCKTTLLNEAYERMVEFKPDFVLLCVKPQVLMASMKTTRDDTLKRLLSEIPNDCVFLSLLAGIKSDIFSSTFKIPPRHVVRVMLNTAAEFGSTSVFYHSHQELHSQAMIDLFELIGKPVVRLNDESLMDVATGVCGSGIAFFYEMIQSMSDIGVKNGLSRVDATKVAAQLSKAAGEMVLNRQQHPYQLRDEVSSPAGTTIYGLSSWHELSTGQRIGSAVQASIDRAKTLSSETESRINLDRDKT